jgi:hypothetical protein
VRPASGRVPRTATVAADALLARKRRDMLTWLLGRRKKRIHRGYLFAASEAELAAMDLTVGPTRPMRPGPRGKAATPLRELEPPYPYAPELLQRLVHAVLGPESEAEMEVVRRDGDRLVLRFPREMTDRLAQLTPDRAPDEILPVIEAWAARVRHDTEVPASNSFGKLESAILFVRGEALKCAPRDGMREVYYYVQAR